MILCELNCFIHSVYVDFYIYTVGLTVFLCSENSTYFVPSETLFEDQLHFVLHFKLLCLSLCEGEWEREGGG